MAKKLNREDALRLVCKHESEIQEMISWKNTGIDDEIFDAAMNTLVEGILYSEGLLSFQNIAVLEAAI